MTDPISGKPLSRIRPCGRVRVVAYAAMVVPSDRPQNTSGTPCGRNGTAHSSAASTSRYRPFSDGDPVLRP